MKNDGGPANFDLIGRYVPERSRPAQEPGGQECEECGCIFIGAEWHRLCRVCCEDEDAIAMLDARASDTQGEGE